MELVFNNNAYIRLFVILCLLSLCLRVSNAYEENETATTDQDITRPEVTVLQGSIRGVRMSTLNNRSIAGFLGIPYAQPPIGNLRFKAPVPAHAWSGTLDAGSDSPDCPQLSKNAVKGNEDCLYTNVYTPQLPTNVSSKLLPVMMFIHGGAFHKGSNNSTDFGPGYLLDKDVVLVVPSYRLGSLGFLSTGDAESLGNWGLKDQILALKWIRHNIELFGGDPNQVTVLGQSSSSMSVNYLPLMNSAAGLFHRYVLQSGSGLSTLAYQPRATSTEYAIRMGKHLGCSTDTSAVLIKCLRASEVTDILKTDSLYKEWGEFPTITAAPTIEPDLDGAVLTDSPKNLMATRQFHDLPRLVGSIPGDGMVFSGYLISNPDKFDDFLDNFDKILPYVLNYNDKVENVSAYTAALKSYYFNNNLTAVNKTMILSNLTRLCSDFLAKFPNQNELQQAPVTNSQYMYSFEYRGTYSYSYMWASGSTEDFGATHSDDLLYLFPQLKATFGESASMSETDLKMVKTMVELWTSFVITGKPETTALSCNESWPAYSEQMKYLEIGHEADVSLRVKSSEIGNQMQFYRKLPV